jgi:homopolymeric O-antigen transport system permease protein
MAQASRPLPDVWLHRTAARTWSGALDGKRAPGAPTRGPRWTYVLRMLTRYEFHARYRAQALGVVWSFLNPLVMMAILSLIFTHVFPSATKNFPIFVLIGLVVWQWVSAATNAATLAFVSNADVVKRTVFARQLLPLSMVLSYGINFLMEASLLLVFIPIFSSSFKLSPALLLVPVLLGWLLVLLSGVALMVSVLNVIYRDLAYLVQTGLYILYWLTPVIYPLDVVPEPYQTVLKCNPIGAILTALRGAIMLGDVPSPLGWTSIVLPSLVVFGLGWVVFRHYERMVLDYV